MAKMGFYYNQDDCIGCGACQIACKDKNDLPVGIVFRSVSHYETGAFPSARIYHHSSTCNHCTNPVCVQACPSGAMYVNESDGTVQHDDSSCIGCQYCVNACPYGNPKYDPRRGVSVKCDACVALRAGGEPPACVAACATRCLRFGEVSELEAIHPDAVRELPILPPPDSGPCTLIDPTEAALSMDFRRLEL